MIVFHLVVVHHVVCEIIVHESIELGSIYIGHRHNLYYFSCCENIFKLNYIMNRGIKCTLWALMWGYSPIRTGGKVKSLTALNMYLPPFFKEPQVIGQFTQKPFHGHNDVGYSFVISTSIKQVKCLECLRVGVISVPFAFGSCCCEPTSCSHLSIQVKQTIVSLQKQQIHQRDSKNIRSGQINVWYILRKTEHTGELSNIKRPGRPRRTTVVDDRRILSMVKKNLSQHPAKRRTLSRRYVCQCQVYNQEKTSMRANTKGSPQRANKARLDFAKKHKKNPDQFWKSILWTAEIKINLYQNDGKEKKVWRRLGTAHDPKHTTSSVKHSGAVWWHEHAWLPVALGYWCLVMTWQKTEAAGWILKCTVIYSAQVQSMEQVDWAVLHSTNGRWPKTYSKSNPGVFEGKKKCGLFCNGQINLLISTRLSMHFTCWRQN